MRVGTGLGPAGRGGGGVSTDEGGGTGVGPACLALRTDRFR